MGVPESLNRQLVDSLQGFATSVRRDTAGFEFRRDLKYSSGLAANLDLDSSGRRFDFDNIAVQNPAIHFPITQSEGGRFSEQNFFDHPECSRLAKNRKHGGRPGLLHLDRCKENVQGSCLKQALLCRSKYFRGEIVDVRLNLDNRLLGVRFFEVTEYRSQSVWPVGQVPRSQPVPDRCRAHFGKRTDRMLEFSHDCGSSRCDQLKRNIDLANWDVLEDLESGRARQRIFSMGKAKCALALDQSRATDPIDFQRFDADACKDNIDNRIEPADFVELHFFDRCAVNLCFRFTDPLKDR